MELPVSAAGLSAFGLAPWFDAAIHRLTHHAPGYIQPYRSYERRAVVVAHPSAHETRVPEGDHCEPFLSLIHISFGYIPNSVASFSQGRDQKEWKKNADCGDTKGALPVQEERKHPSQSASQECPYANG